MESTCRCQQQVPTATLLINNAAQINNLLLFSKLMYVICGTLIQEHENFVLSKITTPLSQHKRLIFSLFFNEKMDS